MRHAEHRTHRKKVWVVGKAHPRRTSSVVVTSVQVIHTATSWPASRLRTNLFDQILENLAQKVLKNTGGESNRTLGLEIPSVFTARVVGPSSTSNSNGSGEGDWCLAFVGTAIKFDSMGALGDLLCRRDGSPVGSIDTGLSSFLSADPTTRVNS